MRARNKSHESAWEEPSLSISSRAPPGAPRRAQARMIYNPEAPSKSVHMHWCLLPGVTNRYP